MDTRYAANMLFQYRVVPAVQKRCTCESRIVVFKAASPSVALRTARRLGKERGYTYRNVLGGRVHVEFLGLIELLELEPECAADETWYRMFTSSRPKRFLARPKELSAFQSKARTIGSAIWAVPASPHQRSKSGKVRPSHRQP
jgi:Domain of unknown function (DUF4288)